MPLSLSFLSYPLAASTALIAPYSRWAALHKELRGQVHMADWWSGTEPTEKAPLVMAEMRSLKDFASRSAVGEYRLVYIPYADHLRGEVANALLKIVEEPPPYLYCILLAETASFLPTLGSRLSIVSIPDLAQDEDSLSASTWQKVVNRYNPSEESDRAMLQQLLFWQPLVHQTINKDLILSPFQIQS